MNKQHIKGQTALPALSIFPDGCAYSGVDEISKPLYLNKNALGLSGRSASPKSNTAIMLFLILESPLSLDFVQDTYGVPLLTIFLSS